MRLYKICRPETYDERNDPQEPSRSFPFIKPQYPRRFENNEIVNLEANLLKEPYIQTKKEMTEFIMKWKINYEKIRSDFIENYD